MICHSAHTQPVIPPSLLSLDGKPLYAGRIGGAGIRAGARSGIANKWGGGGAFSPLDDADITDWYAPRLAETLTTVGSEVSVIENLVSGGFDATASDRADVGDTINGVDALNANDNVYVIDFDYTNGHTIFFVANVDDGTDKTVFESGSNGLEIKWQLSGKCTLGYGDGSTFLTSTDNVPGGDTIFLFIAGANGSAIYYNGGTAQASSGSAATFTQNCDRFGRGSFGYEGAMGDIIHLGTDNASAARLNAIGQYLDDIYSLGVWSDIS